MAGLKIPKGRQKISRHTTPDVTHERKRKPARYIGLGKKTDVKIVDGYGEYIVYTVERKTIHSRDFDC